MASSTEPAGEDGTVSEAGALRRLSETPKKMGQLAAGGAMEDALPVFPENAPASLLAVVLEHHPAALIQKNGKIVGIVSKSDLLKAFLENKGKKRFF